eukprot:12561680-Ditylum_brightwellii.AAC.1
MDSAISEGGVGLIFGLGAIDTSMPMIPAVPSVFTSSGQTLINVFKVPDGSSVTSDGDAMRPPMKPMVWRH